MDAVLTADMRAVIEAAHLCFAATVTPDGRPSLSPKGTIRVLDDRRLFFLDLASPGTRANLAAHPWLELNVVETLSRRGYRFFGRAEWREPGDPLAAACAARVLEEEGVAYEVHGVVVLEVERALPVVSPGYAHVPDEAAMRAAWRSRRAALEAAFEAHLSTRHGEGGRP